MVPGLTSSRNLRSVWRGSRCRRATNSAPVRIVGSVVKVPALVTVLAVLVGAAVLGVAGALVAIPIAAARLLLAREVVLPHLDRA